jgi:hypothetical protein
MNVDKTKVRRILSEPSSLEVMVEQKQLENVEYFDYLGSMITNDARCTREIKYRTVMAKTAYNSQKNLSPARRIFHQQIGLKFKGEKK